MSKRPRRCARGWAPSGPRPVRSSTVVRDMQGSPADPQPRRWTGYEHPTHARRPRMTGGGPLADVLVVDLSRALAGPHAAMMLGDLGARVIKVETPGTGDDTRGWGPPFVG